MSIMKKNVFKTIGLLMISALLLTGCKGTGTDTEVDPEQVTNLTGTGSMFIGNEGSTGEGEGKDEASIDTGTADAGSAGADETTADNDAASQDVEQGNTEESDDGTGEGDIDPDELISDVDLLNMLIDASNTIQISVVVVNLCGVDIGMVASLDPYTGEQLNLGPLPPDQVMSITEYWPMDKTIYDIAVYNVNGDLVSSSEIDITGIQNSLTITFSGDGDLEKVESKID